MHKFALFILSLMVFKLSASQLTDTTYFEKFDKRTGLSNVSIYCTKLNGKLNGYYEVVGKGGTKLFKTYYENGIELGPAYFFYPNGKMKEIKYLVGDSTVNIIEFSVNGVPYKVYTLVAGKLNGEFRYNYKNGKIWHQMNYLNGILNDKELYYSKRGKITMCIVWKDGVVIDTVTY